MSGYECVCRCRLARVEWLSGRASGNLRAHAATRAPGAHAFFGGRFAGARARALRERGGGEGWGVGGWGGGAPVVAGHILYETNLCKISPRPFVPRYNHVRKAEDCSGPPTLCGDGEGCYHFLEGEDW